MIKNYNKLTGLYRFKKWNTNNPNSKTVDFFDTQTIKQFTKTGDKTYSFFGQDFMEFDYKHYLFWSLRWFAIRTYRPIKQLNKQSKKHITIVVLMLITILVMILIAYKQGILK
jgi:hypothetical protein